MVKILALVCMLLLLAVPGMAQEPAAETRPVWSPDGTQIAFASNRLGYTTYYIMNADGTDIRELLPETERVWDVAWSPDGAYMAAVVVMPEDERQRLHIYDAAGNLVLERRFLFNVAEPRWSPDSSELAFITRRFEDSIHYQTLWVVAPDGDNLRPVYAEIDVYIGDIGWTPDGLSLLVYNSSDDEAYLVDSADGLIRNTYAVGNFYNFAWLEGENAFLVNYAPVDDEGRTTEPTQLYRVDVFTGERTRVSEAARVLYGISPDGEQIVYVSFPQSPLPSFYIADIDGSNPREILTAENFQNFSDAAWSPDGTQIVMNACVRDSSDILVYDVASERISNLTEFVLVVSGAQIFGVCGVAG